MTLDTSAGVSEWQVITKRCYVKQPARSWGGAGSEVEGNQGECDAQKPGEESAFRREGAANYVKSCRRDDQEKGTVKTQTEASKLLLAHVKTMGYLQKKKTASLITRLF